MPDNSARIPVIDISPLVGTGDVTDVAREIERACRDNGFFYVTGHGIGESLLCRLEELSREFFALDEQTKLRIGMKHGGRAWRGYFPLGDELTSGKPDQKEGLYFGSELDDQHPKVKAGLPLHGPNLFPSRIFHYPPLPPHPRETLWSVGEHTDYGLLTILKQDETGGLEVKSQGEWIEASPVPGSFVCNIGDMLDRMTGGLYRSTPHRVRNRGVRGRCSFPFFFDPGWDAEVNPILENDANVEDHRWDGANLNDMQGTYGEYLMRKISKVFPDLSEDEL